MHFKVPAIGASLPIFFSFINTFSLPLMVSHKKILKGRLHKRSRRAFVADAGNSYLKT
jgi:hypothetical protein